MYITMEEYNTLKIYELDSRTYKRILESFTAVTNNSELSEKIIKKFWFKTIRELSCNSMVDISSCFVFLGWLIRSEI